MNQAFAVIFDKDGVLLSNNEWHLKSWLIFADKLGIELPEDDFPTKVFGKTNEQILAVFFPEASQAQLETWSLEKETLYRDMYRPHFELTPNLVPFLQRLKSAGIKTAVASNAPLVNVDFTLDTGNIRQYFDQILYADLVPKPKPAPDIYLEAASRLGLKPDDCFVIEDSPTGLQAAISAGCKAIAITTTYREEVLRTLTHRIIQGFDELDGDWWNLWGD